MDLFSIGIQLLDDFYTQYMMKLINFLVLITNLMEPCLLYVEMNQQ